MGVGDQGDVLEARAELVRTVLVEETIKRRATRATVEPEDHGVGSFVSLRGNEDVVVVLGGARQVDVARVHLDERSFL